MPETRLDKDFLLFEAQHARAEARWRQVLVGLGPRAAAWTPWIPRSFAGGAPVPRHGNPICDGRAPEGDRAFRIIQRPPWSSGVDIGGHLARRQVGETAIEELVIHCALGVQSVRTAVELLSAWIIDREPWPRMELAVERSLAPYQGVERTPERLRALAAGPPEPAGEERTPALREEVWSALVSEVATPARAWERWLPQLCWDGTELEPEDRPAWDGRFPWLRRAVRILEVEPGTSFVELWGWVDRLEGQEYGPDPIEELTIACAPSAQALDAARALLRRWVVEGSSPGAMTALLSDGA